MNYNVYKVARQIIFLFISFCQALLTLPVGPIESQQSWYAGARLGIYVCTVLLWGAGIESRGPEIHFFVSRVKEKGAAYSASIHDFVCTHLISWADVANAEIWSDGGKHFRSAAAISSATCRVMQKICTEGRHRDINPTVEVCFGVAAHFKNQCDGAQSGLRAALVEMTKKELINSPQMMINCCRAIYQEFMDRSGPGSRMVAHWHDYTPELPKDQFVRDKMWTFAPKSFCEQISCCHSWSLRLNDTRRRGRPLFVNHAGVLKAVNFCAQMLKGARPTGDRTVCPVLIPNSDVAAVPAGDVPAVPAGDVPAVPAGVVPADAAAEDEECDIPLMVKEHRGWLTSYRKHQPEKKCFSAWRDRFSKCRLRYVFSFAASPL